MPLDTTFAPPRVDIGSGLSSLMDQFKAARLQAVRKDALSGLMQGGGGEEQYRSSIAKLLGYGDIQGASAITSYYKAAHPEINPYQALTVGLAQDRLQKDAAQSVINKYPQSRRDYWAENPPEAPDDYRQAQEVLTGTMAGSSTPSGPTLAPTPPQAGPQPVVAPGATALTPTVTAPPPKPLPYEKWRLIQSGKMQPPEQARTAISAVDSMLDNTKQQAEALLNDPLLPNVFGGVMTGITSGNPAAGSYNVLPNAITSGAPVAQTAKDLDSLRTQVSTVIVNALKETGGQLGGSTGLGRVLQSEFAAWQNAFGSFDKDTSVEGAKKSLQRLIDFIDTTKKRHEATYKSDYGDAGVYPTQSPTPDTAPPPMGAALPTSNQPSPLNAPQVGGATQPIVQHQTPEQTRSVISAYPEGATGTVHLSDGSSVKVVKKNGHLYSVDTGKIIPGG